MRNFVVVVVVFCLQIRSNKMSETKRKQRNKVICKFNNLISGFRYEYNFLLRLRLAQNAATAATTTIELSPWPTNTYYM